MMAQVKTEKPKANPEIAKVLAVFVADCQATKGHGSTVALVRGASGKCRLYGKDSLANAFPLIEAVCRTFTSARKMAGEFDVPIVVGKLACDKFIAENAVKFAGSETVLADKGKGKAHAGGFRQINYATF